MKLQEKLIKIYVDYAPKTNGKKFDAWCAKYQFDPLNSARRAWCSSHSTYFRDAIGVALTESGSSFLVYADDFPDEDLSL